MNFKTDDLVLVINADYDVVLIGNCGIVAHGNRTISAKDKYGLIITGEYVVVDIFSRINRFGNSLWYLKPSYLIKIDPGKILKTDELSYGKSNKIYSGIIDASINDLSESKLSLSKVLNFRSIKLQSGDCYSE